MIYSKLERKFFLILLVAFHPLKVSIKSFEFVESYLVAIKCILISALETRYADNRKVGHTCQYS